MPLFIGEFGVDAYDAVSAAAGRGRQADATGQLGAELRDAAAARSSGVVGGFVFEWADEWRKAGPPYDEHRPGAGPAGGPFNEAWFGLVDIDREPRPAYDAVKVLRGGRRA